MGFEIKVVDEVNWPVTADIPQDGGKVEKHKFYARFRFIDRDEFNRLSALGEEALLRHTLLGCGNTAKTIEIDEAKVRKVCNIPYYATAIYQAYLRFLVGSESKN
ncbi:MULTISPECIES: hypothetical protein [Idiomarina]|jgi:hypothetical protein|uniref:hypothetical protein n=1 Tax=Idiomarina TaxID=135575 RepID=UPI00129AF648|nr:MULTISPECIES: hypothetical protein [Idiomarina]MRJ41195.1 hypothetical protein [Idiomarina sp. FeN1]NCU56360.1 hypothetical protein [Idiomarina sp. FenA--70]NCU59379.1 hypothetical protein [Idiomarina sp. FenBw--71]UUN12554.1 hypothetical protein KGF88_07750 [Idiomarina loihiensis]